MVREAGYRAPTGRFWGLARKFALMLPLGLFALYTADWYRTVQQEPWGMEAIVRRADFIATLTGARIIHDGNGPLLYDLSTQLITQNEIRSIFPYLLIAPDAVLPYNHLPFEALAVAPLMNFDLPYPVIFGLWVLLTAVATVLALWIMRTTLPVAGQAGVILFLALLTYQPVIRSFILGQNSPLVLLGLCGTYAALRRGWQGWAGLAMLLVALKPQVLPVVLLVLLLQRQWRTLSVFAVSFLAACVAAIPVLGKWWMSEYARLLLGVANWGDTGAIDPAIMYNWRGLVTNALPYVQSYFPDLTEMNLMTPIIGSLTVASIGLLAFGWLTARAKPPLVSPYENAPSVRYDLLWALTGFIAVLSSLHLNPHDLTLLLFPAWIVGAYALHGPWSKRASRFWVGLMWLCYLLIPAVPYYSQDPALSVVPQVLFMTLAALILLRQVGEPGRIERRLKPAAGAT
jgi:hypothetical protein